MFPSLEDMVGGIEDSLDLPEEGLVGVVSENKETSLESLEEGQEDSPGEMPNAVSNFLRALRKADRSVDHSNGQVRGGSDVDLPLRVSGSEEAGRKLVLTIRLR